MPRRRRSALCGALLSLLLAARAAAAALALAEVADVHRALTLLSFAGEEYREGVVDGQVLLPVEYQESQAFLDEAQSRLRGAVPQTAAAVEADFAAARAGVAERIPLARVQEQLAALRAAISASTGIAEEVFPADPPSASRGRALFAENCVPCHGEHANGAGPEAARLDPRPANFSDAAFMAHETPFDFFHVISVGKGSSAMPAWGDVFSLQERWDLVSYLWTVQPGRPGLAAGQGVYLSACAGCHGVTGDGQGAYSAALLAPVGRLDRTQVLARQSNDDLVAIIAQGVSGTPMPGFSGRLSDAQIRDTAAYVRLLSLGGDDGTREVASSAGEAARFAGLLRLLSAEYQKAVVPGAAVDPQELTESQILLAQAQGQWSRVRAALASRDAATAAAVDAQMEELSVAIRDQRPAAAAVAASGRAAAAIEASFPSAATGPAPSDALAEAGRLLDAALAAYRDGNPRAVYTVSDAYFLFDPLEQQLSLVDDALRRQVEARFADLRGVMSAPGRTADAERLVAGLHADFEHVRSALAPQPNGGGLAFQSAFIILREGFEVVLIVGALLAYVAKLGTPVMRAAILWGTAAGVAASLLTAFALAQLFTAAGATAEVLEGATMLLASGVLFFVSYWLISKAESERWQRYIQGKVRSAVAGGNVLALAGAAFLAVYREGVETVLFYDALLGSAAGQRGAVVGGFACGVLALAVVYVLYQRLGRRLPMRQFFLATGALLYYLAVVFAGKGVAALQGAGWVRTTPIGWVPRVDAIGLYPTLQTAAAQGLLLLCVVYAVVVTLRQARSDRAAQLQVQVASRGGAKV